MAKRYEDRYGRGSYERDRDRAHDRGYMDRATDEVRSWFGDDDAERRRRADEYRDRTQRSDYRSSDRGYRDWTERDRLRRESSYTTEWQRRNREWSGSSPRTEGPRGNREWSSGMARREWEPMRASDRPSMYRSWSADEGRAESGADYWGRGPKGYQRSDNRIHEDVCDRLTFADVDAENIEVSVSSGEVTLSGTVRDRWDKRRAEDIAEAVTGVRDVHNQIRLQRDIGTNPIGSSD